MMLSLMRDERQFVIGNAIEIRAIYKSTKEAFRTIIIKYLYRQGTCLHENQLCSVHHSYKMNFIGLNK